jgi:hypothetical protein
LHVRHALKDCFQMQVRQDARRALQESFQMQVRHNAHRVPQILILTQMMTTNMRNVRHVPTIHIRHRRAHHCPVAFATLVLTDQRMAHVMHVLLENTKALAEHARLVMRLVSRAPHVLLVFATPVGTGPMGMGAHVRGVSLANIKAQSAVERARRVLCTHVRTRQARQSQIVSATLVIPGPTETLARRVHEANIKVKLEVSRARCVLAIHMRPPSQTAQILFVCATLVLADRMAARARHVCLANTKVSPEMPHARIARRITLRRCRALHLRRVFATPHHVCPVRLDLTSPLKVHSIARRVLPTPFRQPGASQAQLVCVMLDFEAMMDSENQRRHVSRVILYRTKLQLETNIAHDARRTPPRQALEVFHLVLARATLATSV